MILSRLYRWGLRRRFHTRAFQGEPVLIVTRSINATLYGRSQALLTLPYKRHRIVGLNHWMNARDYLHVLFEHDVKWLMNLDEDCFVFDNARLAGLLQYMQEQDYDFCGIPDGGACIHRFHNPVAMNPFFNIFHVGRIRPKLRACDAWQVNQRVHRPEFESFTPRSLMKEGHKFAYDNFECFYGFFFWLLENGFKPLYLPSRELADGLTTEVQDHKNRPFMYHTWFARSYESDAAHHARIDRAFERACNAEKE